MLLYVPFFFQFPVFAPLSSDLTLDDLEAVRNRDTKIWSRPADRTSK